MPGEDIYSWSPSATLNGNSDTSINWAEGQPRASVNNSSRSQMAAHAKQRDQQNGSIVTGGTADAQTFFSGNNYTTVPTGMLVLLKIGPSLTNTGAATLNMDNIGAVAIKNQEGEDLAGGELNEGLYREFIYNGTNWLLTGVSLTEITNIVNIETITTVNNITDAAVVDFTTGITDDFHQYIFLLTNFVPSVDSTRLIMQVSTDAGLTWKGLTNYRWVRSVMSSSTPTEVYISGHEGKSSIQMSHTCSNNSARGLAGEVRMYSPWRTTQINPLMSAMSSWDGTDMLYSIGSSVYVGGGTVNAVRFSFESGNITSGTIILYGVGKTS
jgi:hypothetical protein